jgi:capsular exopolysaccharide synthesis family protein
MWGAVRGGITGQYDDGVNARVDPAPDFASHLRVLFRRRRTVAVVLVSVVAVTMAVSFMRDPVYRATVKVLLERGRSETVLDLPSANNANPERRVETEMDIIRSEPVQAAVEEDLGAVPKVSVSQVGASDILSVAVRSTDKARAAQIASAYANAYIEFRRGQAVQDLDAAVEKLEARIDELQRQIDALDPGVGSQTRDQLLVQQTSYRQRLHDLQIDAELTSGGARVVTQGEVPVIQVEPAPVKSGLMAVAAGLILGIGAVFLTEYLDDTVRTKEDLERVTGGLATLALIPAVKPGRRDSEEVVMTLSDPMSPAAEAFRVLRTSFEFLDVKRAPGVIQVTSAVAGEGKTSIAANLAVSFARGGQRVILVDCDLRRPRVHQFFGCSNEIGTVSVLLGRQPLEHALQSVPDVPGLQLLPGDSAPPNVLELLGSRKTAQLLAQLQSMADVVVIDCPPVLPVTDAAAMSAWVDATLVVASAGMTSGRELRRTVERLTQIRAPLVGAVLNRVSDDGEYGYLYYDYHEGTKRQRRTRREPLEPHTNGSNGSGARPADLGEPQVDRPQ